ncbi:MULTISPECIES: phosphoadenylyl-sulfate reductase [Actinomadura]|uniref:Adenosine 5'-phosphosulfate reductase n=1 Tax=Actinomadura madurae TaxID=1993 RepID=A0A1I4ZWM5_9ACTN|nr:phosphoadenylyl-sulfate reductase [Actinomadura madurae]MCP9948926.1 phosphoadenylyl-sulfate reductase [Actinomadura madurae]MCP9965696.1 phosphoadenylyl-sulfate reductase [Actinomadura madurae]MCP9978168.1 phosphoadenylyl-sulfate reductase [Actinomadura madurae]MCQ0010312.1 phosphoadenylyl-sulfate reductase [Actinomadura madurae]MCQ0014376.1 phosphoadenylyl-sulfate reductase [Actinomadura madurae]
MTLLETDRPTLDLEDIVESAAAALEGAPTLEVIRWAAATFGDRICLTSSMSDAALIHLVSKVKPGIDVLFVDTGYHFAETIGTRDAVEAVYPVNVINVAPSRTVEEQEAALGPRLFGRNPDLCCHLRKVEPLGRALEGYMAWFSGIRRDETASRRDRRVVEWDRKRGMVKVNPILDWSQEDMDNYIEDNGVIINPLHYDGYPSIGCEPCTLPVAPGEDPRSGRWAGLGKTECGIHL